MTSNIELTTNDCIFYNSAEINGKGFDYGCNKIKISVVGIGLMGQQHIKAINKSKLCVLHSIVEIKQYESKIVKK